MALSEYYSHSRPNDPMFNATPSPPVPDFNIPDNLMGPQSNAMSSNSSFGETFGTGQNKGGSSGFGKQSSQSNSNSLSNSFSGLDSGYRNELMGGVIPQLTQSASGLSGQVDKYVDNASSLYQNLTNQAMQRQLPGLLGSLANRGMLNSSVASNAIGGGAAEIAKAYGNKLHESGMQGAQMQMQIPSILGALAQLGQYQKANSESNTSSSSQGQNRQSSFSQGNTLNMGNTQSEGLSGSQSFDDSTSIRMMIDMLNGGGALTQGG